LTASKDHSFVRGQLDKKKGVKPRSDTTATASVSTPYGIGTSSAKKKAHKRTQERNGDGRESPKRAPTKLKRANKKEIKQE